MVQLSHARQTPRLTLRRFELDDLDDLALILANEEVNRYLYSEPRDRATKRVIGEFILRWTENEHRQGEIGGSLHPDFHRQGYSSEVYEELLVLAFTQYGLHRVVGRCDARNAASVRSLENVGLHQEAHLVENEFVKGEWTDEIVMAIRKDEWERQRASREV